VPTGGVRELTLLARMAFTVGCAIIDWTIQSDDWLVLGKALVVVSFYFFGIIVVLWWYQRPAFVESNYLPVREQSPDQDISMDSILVSGSISDSCLSNRMFASERAIPGGRYLDESKPHKRWYQRVASVKSNHLPVREPSPNYGISMDLSLISGGIISFDIS
jgi:hypothetical protein